MCGIVGYIGYRQAAPLIINGLKRLEYRGYDSAGLALMKEGSLQVDKVAGKVNDLEKEIEGKDCNSQMGLGHTRWATHGEPSQVNAHPHLSNTSKLAIIHNGIIENYNVIKKELKNRGYTFKSGTDSEILIQFIEDIKESEQVSLEQAVRTALSKVVGAYAIVVMSTDEPGQLVAARKGSPLVVGIGEGEYFLASDATPIIEHTRNVTYLKDNEVAIVSADSFTLKTIENKIQTPYIEELSLNLEALEKGGYEHFMLKEIYEQPRAIRDSFRGRLNQKKGTLKLGGIEPYENLLKNVKRVIIVACGTSWHAGLIAEYIMEELVRIPVEVEYASEFRYRNPVLFEDDLIIAISQSGETADTLAAIEMAKEKGATIFGICNVVGSSIPRATHAGVYTHAGPEIGVASTKAFTTQLTVLSMIAMLMAERRGMISDSYFQQLVTEFEQIPDKIEETFKLEDQIYEISKEFKDAHNFLYLGRSYNFPVALEGALKLKEISYIHAEGYPAAEMKHGPIALIDENMPAVVIATNKHNYEKVVSNIQEVKARKGRIISIVSNGGDETIRELSDYVINIPETNDLFSPLISVIPLQLLSYHIAVLRGCNVDQPRNLAKSVTVE